MNKRDLTSAAVARVPRATRPIQQNNSISYSTQPSLRTQPGPRLIKSRLIVSADRGIPPIRVAVLPVKFSKRAHCRYEFAAIPALRTYAVQRAQLILLLFVR